MPGGGWTIALFGLSGVMSGQFVGYNGGLASGVVGFLISTILVGLGYLMLANCMGEMASVIPFCGGSYGFARFVFGKHIGFFVGFIESVEYIFLATTNIYFLAQIITKICKTSTSLEPIWWLFIYFFNLGLQLIGKKTKWNYMVVFGIFNIMILIVFCCATASFANMSKNGALPITNPAKPIDKWVTTDASVWFQSFPFAVWFYIGVEVIPMCSEETAHPRQVLVFFFFLFEQVLFFANKT
jgi:ethanolamine permease